MKRNFFIAIATVAGASMMLFSSCTKEGPAGPAGSDGKDGVDGNVTCLACHSTDKKTEIEAQYHSSVHAAGGAVDYAGGRSSCAQCHSQEGFMEFHNTGAVSGDIGNPSEIGCQACHEVHTSFDSTDYALRTTAAVELIANGDGTMMDYNGSANLCINCHQARKEHTYYDDGTAHADSVYVSSTHAGPHHGPQAQFVKGLGGTFTGEENIHLAKGYSCTECHMNNGAASEGGHTLTPSVETCKTCHSSATDLDINGYKTAILADLVVVRDKLVAKGALEYDATEDSYHPAKTTLHRDVYQALWNYLLVAEDASGGLHNHSYAESLLEDANTKLDAH